MLVPLSDWSDAFKCSSPYLSHIHHFEYVLVYTCSTKDFKTDYFMMYCRVVEFRYYFCYPFSVVYNVGDRLHSLWTGWFNGELLSFPKWLCVLMKCVFNSCIYFRHLCSIYYINTKMYLFFTDCVPKLHFILHITA